MANKPKKIIRSWVKENVSFARENSNSEFYNSWSWRKLSKSFRERYPLCKHCQDNGLVTKATVVDHIIPINKGGDKMNENNLQSLCESCHNRKSSLERG